MRWIPAHRYEAIGEETPPCGVGGHRQADTGRRRRLLRASLPCGVLLCVVGLWVAVRSNTAPYRSSSSNSSSSGAGDVTQGLLYGLVGSRSTTEGRREGLDADAMMQVLVTNNYQRDDGSTKRMYPWEHVAEPTRDTRLEILSWPGRDDGAALDYIWRVRGEVVGMGTTISTIFPSPGVYECSVNTFKRAKQVLEGGGDDDGAHAEAGDEQRAAETAYRDPPSTRNSGRADVAAAAAAADDDDDDDAVAGNASRGNQLDFVVTVKYVRREIRALTDRDRETFFNAVSVMQRVPSAVGRKVFGHKYYSKDYFNRMHLYYGGRRDCDHWHAGAGFVTSHIAISLMYEQSLQAINPSIALPYWDFTIEGTFYDWSNFRKSSLFSDDWFGDAAPLNAMRTPSRGRFGYVPTMMNATEYSDVYNSYGMLRSPWNNDPTPFLTRSDHLLGYINHRKPSGCRRYRDAMMQRTWMALTVAFNDGAHGEIHELLGGSWSRNATDYADRTNTIVQPFVHKAVPFLKMLWRAGYIGCPDTCGIDVPWEHCACTCSSATFGGQAPWEVLQDSGILEVGFFYDKDAVLIDSLVDEEGNAYEAIPGYTKEETENIYDEMLRSLCTPMRFGTHYGATSTNDPTFFLIHPTFDRLWHLRRLEASKSFNEVWVPDHSCYGHNPDDIQPFHNLFLQDTFLPDDKTLNEEVEAAKEYYTNHQLYTMLRPDQMDSPYIYDNFEWSHCAAQGVFIRSK
eukprot:g11520.t1